MTGDWRQSTLGEVARWGSGGTPQAGNSAYYGGDIPWAVIGDLNDAVVSRTAASITEEGLRRSSAKLVPAGAVLVAMYGSIGKLGVAGARMATNQAIAFAIPHEFVDRGFLFYYLLSQRHELDRAGKGATQRNIGQAILKAWPIRYPSLLQQRRVVSLLEEHLSDLDDGMRTLANSVARVELLEGAVLEHGFRALDSPSLAMANLIRPGRRMAYGVLVPGEDIDSGIPMIRVGDLRLGSVGRSLKRISPDIERRFPRSRVEPGDLLLSVVGTIGRVAVVPEWARGFNVARAVSVIPLNDQVHPEFARLALQRPSEQRKLVAAAHEVARKTLNLEDLRRFTIPAPPLARQEQVAATLLGRLSACERTRGAIDHQAKKAVGLRRAVLEAAFSGRLTGHGSDTNVIEELAEEESA